MVVGPTGLFDLYYVMVDVLFGSVLISGLAMAAFILIICLVGRMSMITTLMWVGFFLMVFSIGYVGALALVLSTAAGFVYLSSAIIKVITEQ